MGKSLPVRQNSGLCCSIEPTIFVGVLPKKCLRMHSDAAWSITMPVQLNGSWPTAAPRTIALQS